MGVILYVVGAIVGLFGLYLLVKELKKASDPNSPLVHFAKFLGGAMEEEKGEPSLTRWNNFFAALWWVPAVAGGYLFIVVASFWKNEFIPLIVPLTVSMLSAIGTLLGIKVLHDKVVSHSSNSSSGQGQ